MSSASRSSILVVDDEPFNRDLLVQELDAYDTRVAATGEEALASVAANPPDLILLDVMMPGIDGFEVCRRLKSGDATRLIPIVIMTALGGTEEHIRGIEAGADDFLTKPVDERQLLARIRTALRAKHYLDHKLDAAAEVARARHPQALGNVRACSKCCAVYSVDSPTCALCGSPVKFFDRDPLIGRRIDRYDILDRWGSGGMGCVYVASHATLKGQRYAIKVLFGELASQREHADRFALEAETCSAIFHPNVVSVLDFGATPEGLRYIVMDFVPGRTLREVIQAEGPLPFRRAASIARQVAAALGCAHAHGVVHRDVKPSNVMVMESELGERVKLLDFGIVKHLGRANLTATGVTLGTPEYMAPEQIRGGEVGPATDLYALGATMYEMITGRPPFHGAVIKVAADKLTMQLEPLQTKTGLDRLTWSLLSPRPEDRPASGDDVIAALDAIAADRNELLVDPLEMEESSTRMPVATPAPSAHEAPTARLTSGAPPEPIAPTLPSIPSAPDSRRLNPLVASIVVGACVVFAAFWWWK